MLNKDCAGHRPKEEQDMDKDFSVGFMHDVADLITICKEKNTNNIELSFDIEGKELKMDITCSVK